MRIIGKMLPASWCRATIGETCEILAGYGFPESLQGRTEGDVPFYKVGDISESWKQGSVNLTKSNHYVSTQDVATLRAKLFPASTTVFAKIGAAIGLNRRAILSVPALADNNVMGLHPNSPALSPSFLYYFTLTLRLAEISQATTVPSIRKPDVGNIEIPLAPQNEQTRIVAEIEKQFTSLDAAVAALRRVQANLKRYRASVLKAACEGRLVPTEAELARREGRSYESASALLDRILAERRIRWKAAQQKRSAKTARGDKWQAKYEEPVCDERPEPGPLPEGWGWVTLDSMLREPLRNGHSAKSVEGASGVPTFTLSAVTYGDFSPANVKNTSADPRKVEDLWVEPGDIFIERSNTPELVGTTRLFSGQAGMAIFPDLLIRVRVVNCVLPTYIELALQSSSSREFFRRNAQGISGTMPKIDQGIVQQVLIPLPPIAEQEKIMKTVEDQFSVIQHLEAELRAETKRADSLRQSILKRAFEGKLVPQDPNDEPASILLERIRGTATPSGTAIPGCAPVRAKSNKPSRRAPVSKEAANA